MLSPDLELAHIDARQWRNGWRLLVPPRVLAQPKWALIIRDGEKVVKTIIGGAGARGTIEVTSGTTAKQLGVHSVITVERRVIAQLSSEIEAALRPEQDGVEQALIALRVVKKYAGNGIWTEPALLDLLPAPNFDSIQRTFDLLVPDRSALVAYVIEDDRTRVHTSIIAMKEHGDITRAASHRAIADLVSEATFARDWEKGYKRVIEAVEERYARPAIGLFLERQTLIDILTGPADQLARELNSKRVVIDPAPAWLLGLLGGAAVAALAGRAASALANMLPQSARDRASAFAQRAKDAFDPFAMLGFDPIELWQRLKHYYRPD